MLALDITRPDDAYAETQDPHQRLRKVSIIDTMCPLFQWTLTICLLTHTKHNCLGLSCLASDRLPKGVVLARLLLTLLLTAASQPNKPSR